MKNRVMVIGANGALGTDLMGVLDHPVAAVHRDFDICSKQEAFSAIRMAGVQAVINTAAFHQVPACETQYARAFEVNVIGVRNLAEICKELRIHLCHISTDYVFDGRKGSPYTEEDAPAPLSIYALTKLGGEYVLPAYGGDYSIVRSSGLYGRVPTRAKGGNFINNMIRLGSEKPSVSVVEDEIVCPTYTRDLALAIKALLDKGGKGTFHIAQTGETNWYEFAKVIFEQRKLPARLSPTRASEFQSQVKRPAYSVLDSGKFEKLTGHRMPDWKDALLRHLKELEVLEGRSKKED